MVDYRACPKCRGDMHTRRDTFGDFKECIQCGLMQDLELQKKSEALVTGDLSLIHISEPTRPY